MLLKNVLKGLKKEYDIKELIIIRGHKIQFAGNLKTFEDAKNNDMSKFANDLLNSVVIARDSIGYAKHFIFLKEVANDNE